MNQYLEARQWLRNGVSFEEFADRLPPCLLDSGLLSLLVGATMEQALEPFDRYLNLLVGQGADVNYSQYQSKLTLNGVKMSLLMFACKKSKIHVVRALLSCPQIQPFHRDQNGRNAVHYAIENPDAGQTQSIVWQLFDKYPQLKDMGNYPKGNYLTLAIREVKPSLVKMLIEEDINPNFRSLEGLGPLHEAVRIHKAHKNKEITMEILRVLLEAGCQQEATNNEGQNYINYAREKGFLQDADIDEILEEIMTIKTPKATIETSPEEKMPEIPSIESGEGQDSNLNNSESDSSEAEDQEESNHYQISAEMYQWAKNVQEQHARIWKLLFPFYSQIQRIVHEFYGSVQVIGSFASQLWIPSSDIDLLLVIPDGGDQVLFEEITETLYKRISLECSFSSIKLIRTYKLPLIKLLLGEEFQRLQIQLFLSNKKNIASKYVAYTNEIMAYFPQISVIYYVLRRLLSLRRLHDHRTGGLKAYALFLLIYSMRNLYQYAYVSQFVEHFCYYYGIAFEYQVEVNQEGEIEYHINIVDPLNSENNMGGKRTDILGLQEALKKIYFALNTPNRGSKMEYIVEVLKHL